jgi:hypothetical protein
MSKHGVETHVITQNQEIKITPSSGKVMLTLFQDFKWTHPGALQGSWTVNSTGYCAILEEKLKPTNHSKCRRMLTNGHFTP